MDDIEFMEISITDDDLFHNVDGVWFGNCFFIVDDFGKVSSLAQLRDQVCVVFGIGNIEEFYYIWWVS